MQTDQDPPTGGQEEGDRPEEGEHTAEQETTEQDVAAAEESADVEAAPEDSAEDAEASEPAAEASADADTEGEAEAAPVKHEWEEMGLPADRIDVLKKLGFEHPMDVQWETHQLVVDDRDLMVQSRTGSGKTAAFGIPLMMRIIGKEDRKPQALALMPTRELAIQVADEISRIVEGTDVEVTALYGGAAIGPQIRKLEQGVQIICGTPGRVLDHIRRGTMQVDSIRTLILDEADEMLSMGFYEELSAIISRIPNREQTLLFSATIPDEVQRLANKILDDPERLLLSEDFVGVKEITHAYYMVSGVARPRDLMRIFEVENVESAIVFCNTREETARLARWLRDAGLKAEAISSDFSQVERERSMQQMRDKKLQYLVATDIAARGIDIQELSHVINFSFPLNADIYVHRTGRTGRAGKSGVAISLISPQELGDFYYMKLTHDIIPEERFIPTQAELAAKREGAHFAALTSQIDEMDEGVSQEYRSLARRIWHSLRGEEIMALLLQEHLAKPRPPRPPRRRPRPEADRDGDRGDSRDRGPRRDSRDRGPRRDSRDRGPRRDSRDRGPRGDSRDRGPRRDSRDRGPRRDSRDRAPRRDAEEGSKLYLSIGRNSGVSPSSLIQFLVSEAGIERHDVHRIQIRDHFSFVNVATNVADDVVAKANGKSLEDKDVSVEHARAR